MKTNSIAIIVLPLFFLNQSIRAEFRVWTDIKGKTIEAEHVHTMNDEVLLKKRDGSEIKIHLKSLVETDRQFALLQAPPRIEIKASPKIERENQGLSIDRGPGVQIQRETVSVEVGIRKSSSAPYDSLLKAEVILIGQSEETGHYIILKRTKSEFQFTAENGNEHEFLSDTVKLKQVEFGIESGVEFKGYMVSVTDSTGELLELKCSKLDFEKNAEIILKSRPMSVFDKDFKPIKLNKAKRREKAKRDVLKRRKPGRVF